MSVLLVIKCLSQSGWVMKAKTFSFVPGLGSGEI